MSLLLKAVTIGFDNPEVWLCPCVWGSSVAVGFFTSRNAFVESRKAFANMPSLLPSTRPFQYFSVTFSRFEYPRSVPPQQGH